MIKLFYGSYVICALLALLILATFLDTYLRGQMAIYNPVIGVLTGAPSLILLASIFFPLTARMIALLTFAVSTISTYVWEISIRPIKSGTMTFSVGLTETLLLFAFVFVPILGIISSASLLRQHAKRKV
ncbi:MAG: hypothetical protein KDD90_04375 [Sphingomonadaceae bacterium]|nr:hypothetical protein [Sphingomonadaceae bacterium]